MKEKKFYSLLVEVFEIGAWIASIAIAIIILVLLSSCAKGGVSLSDEIKSALVERGDEYAAQYADGLNVARTCAEEPVAVYWNESLKTSAVACVVMESMYGIVLLDESNTILNVEHINAADLEGLSDLISSMGWKRVQ